MKGKGSTCFLIVLFLILLMTAAGADAQKTKDRIKVKAVAAIYEPFVYHSNGALTGFDIDLFDIICRTNNLDCEVRIVQFSEALSLVSQGAADVALGSIYVNSDRKKHFNFSNPYFSSGIVKISRVGDQQSNSGFEGKVIGVKKDATGHIYALELRNKFHDIVIQTFDSTEESLQALADKKVDIVLNDYLNSLALINKYYRGKLTIKIGITGPNFFEKNKIAIPIAKSRTELLEIFNSTLSEMSRGKTLDRLKEKWLLGTGSKGADTIKIIIASIIIAALLLVFIIVQWKKARFAKTLAKNEHKYRMLFDANPLAFVIYDVDEAEILAVNQAAAELFNCSKDELVSTPFPDLFITEDRQTIVEKIAKLRDQGNIDESHSGEWRIRGKNNSIMLFEIASQPIEYESRNARLAMLIDITERKLAETQKINSERRFRTAIENAPNVIVILSRSGNVLLVNKMAEELLIQGSEMPQRFPDLCYAVFKDDEQTTKFVQEFMTLTRTLASSAEFNDINLVHADGTEHVWNLHLSCIGRWEDEEAIIVMAKDITEQKKAQEERIHSQRIETIGRLTGGIAHDFNNYLTAIIGYSQIALMRTGEDNPVRKNLEAILAAANKSAALTKQLLAFGRKQIMQMQTLSVNTVISDLSKIFMPLISSNIELSLDLSPDIWSVRADTSQLEQVIMNLVINARDSMPTGGSVTIRTSNRKADNDFKAKYPGLNNDGYVCIDIRDTGCGMTEEVKSKIFEPFFTTKEFGKGTGLGLATAYGIIKQSGGDIFVFSSPDNGTLFRIFLPRTEEMPLIKESREEIRSLPLGTEGVLVVENQMDVRLYIVNILQLLGYKTFEAKDGAEAMEICASRNADINLTLIEMELPKIDGEAVANFLKQTYPGIKTVLITGNGREPFTGGNFVEGLHFIKKPFTASQIAQTIRNALDHELQA